MGVSATREGLVVKIYFTRAGIKKISFLPVYMENFAQPEAAEEIRGEIILERLKFPLGREDTYYWDKESGSFKKGKKAVVYVNDSKREGVLHKKEQADLDRDLSPENYILENGRLEITENSKKVWESPPSWWIEDFILADSNNDGITDINLSLWKSGRFGPSRPFWVKENDQSVKNHFFILDVKNDKVEQIWGSSNLWQPNCEFRIDDIDSDGRNDLVTIEGEYSEKGECDGEYVGVWVWNGWGFSRKWQSERGNFSDLEIEKVDKKNLIVVKNF